MTRILPSLLLLPLLLLTGCATRTLDAQRFQSLTQRHGLGHLYYTGTQDKFHYFATSYFLEARHHYRLPASDYSITNQFPRTSDRSRWVPWLVDLSSGTQGVRGEQSHATEK